MNYFSNYLMLSITAVTLVYGGISNANAQDVETSKKIEFGARLMPTFTAVEMRTSSGGTVSGNAVIGFGASAFLGINFTNHVGIQVEGIYNKISQKNTDNNLERKITLSYVNIPVLLSLNTGKSKVVNFNIVAGPQLGFNIKSSVSTSGTSNSDNLQPILSVKKNDFGFAYGAGVDFGINPNRTARLGFGYRGVSGLLDVSNRSNTITTNSYYLLDRTHLRTNSVYVGLSIMF